MASVQGVINNASSQVTKKDDFASGFAKGYNNGNPLKFKAAMPVLQEALSSAARPNKK
ncbi:MAG: hypothetical protein WC527_06160 [Candidatus Margulisiibacteriota bacterium]